MNLSIKKIQELLSYLPEKDIAIAEKFLSKRDFNSLADLVDSDLYLVRKDQLKETPREEYANISLEKLLELRSELMDYMSYLVLPEDYDMVDYDYTDLDYYG